MPITYRKRSTEDKQILDLLQDEKIIGTIVRVGSEKKYYPRNDEITEKQAAAVIQGMNEFEEIYSK